MPDFDVENTLQNQKEAWFYKAGCEIYDNYPMILYDSHTPQFTPDDDFLKDFRRFGVPKWYFGVLKMSFLTASFKRCF